MKLTVKNNHILSDYYIQTKKNITTIGYIYCKAVEKHQAVCKFMNIRIYFFLYP